jgi:hypothetical protein
MPRCVPPLPSRIPPVTTGVDGRWRRTVSRQAAWRFLWQVGARFLKPRPRHVQADPVAQTSFKAHLRPLLREVATAFPDATVELWAVDEHRIGRDDRRVAGRAHTSLAHSPRQNAAQWASPVFCGNVRQGPIIQRQIRYHLLELLVFLFQLAQSPKLTDLLAQTSAKAWPRSTRFKIPMLRSSLKRLLRM